MITSQAGNSASGHGDTCRTPLSVSGGVTNAVPAGVKLFKAPEKRRNKETKGQANNIRKSLEVAQERIYRYYSTSFLEEKPPHIAV